MRRLPITKQMIAEKTVCILLVRGMSPSGEAIFAYVAVRADKLESFIEAQGRGNLHPEEHGVVIESGYGEPSAEVRERMETEYGFNHQAMFDIPDTEKAREITSNLRPPVENAEA